MGKKVWRTREPQSCLAVDALGVVVEGELDIIADEEVQPAVVVVVDPAEAAAERLLHVVHGCGGIIMAESDATRARHIDEPGRAWCRSCGSLNRRRRGWRWCSSRPVPEKEAEPNPQ